MRGAIATSSGSKKKAEQQKAHLVFEDESGFMLRPTRRRTFAPRGQTPIQAAWDRHDRISAISVLTLSPNRHKPNLFFELLPDNKNVNGPYLVAFLRQLRRHLPGPILLVWDGSPIHRSKVVQRYLERYPNIHIEPLPAYAPELNPDEGVWSYTKYGRMANYAPKNTNVLRQRLTSELTQLQKKPELLRAFIRHTKLSLRL